MSASCTASTRPPISTPRSARCATMRKLAVVTRSEKGCLVVTREETDAVPRRRRSSSWSTPPAPATCSRPGSWSASSAGRDRRDRRAARRARGRRGDPASRRPAGDFAQGAGPGQRPRRLIRAARPVTARYPQQSTENATWSPGCNGTVATIGHYGNRIAGERPHQRSSSWVPRSVISLAGSP